MNLIVIGNPAAGHNYSLSSRIQRAMESATAANESSATLIVNVDPDESTCVSNLSFVIRNILHSPIYFRHEKYDLPSPHQYKRVFRSKPNKNTIAITQSKGFIRLQLYH